MTHIGREKRRLSLEVGTRFGEFYFTDVLWPAFRKVDFLRAIRAYQARMRERNGRATPTLLVISRKSH